jgi:hypothetical protein
MSGLTGTAQAAVGRGEAALEPEQGGESWQIRVHAREVFLERASTDEYAWMTLNGPVSSSTGW